MAGGVVCGTAARRWNGGRALCPRCARGDENAEHRFLVLPAVGERAPLSGSRHGRAGAAIAAQGRPGA
eukprot:4220981-Lingulodinium_polyedra.AAC.1